MQRHSIKHDHEGPIHEVMCSLTKEVLKIAKKLKMVVRYGILVIDYLFQVLNI